MSVSGESKRWQRGLGWTEVPEGADGWASPALTISGESSRPHIDTTAQLCSTFSLHHRSSLHSSPHLCSLLLQLQSPHNATWIRHIKCGSSKEILYSYLLNIWSPSFVPPVRQMAVSRRSQGLCESPPWEQQWTCRPGRFCVPAIQDDTLKVKAVTVRRPVLLGHAHSAGKSAWQQKTGRTAGAVWCF